MVTLKFLATHRAGSVNRDEAGLSGLSTGDQI